MRHAAILLMLGLLAGCIQVGGGDSKDTPAPTAYTLAAASGAPDDSARSQRGGVSVVVPKPEVPPALRTERIALYMDGDRRQDYYSGAKWPAPLADVLQEFVIQAARTELPGKVVDTPELAAHPRYRLAVKVEDFAPHYAGAADKPPKLQAAMTMSVIGAPDGAAKGQVSLKKSAEASANTQTAVTAEMESLLRELIKEGLQKVAQYMR